MTNDQIRKVEVILDGIIKANNPVFAREAPLPLAKEVQGLRACFDEVRTSITVHIVYYAEYIIVWGAGPSNSKDYRDRNISHFGHILLKTFRGKNL